MKWCADLNVLGLLSARHRRAVGKRVLLPSSDYVRPGIGSTEWREFELGVWHVAIRPRGHIHGNGIGRIKFPSGGDAKCAVGHVGSQDIIYFASKQAQGRTDLGKEMQCC